MVRFGQIVRYSRDVFLCWLVYLLVCIPGNYLFYGIIATWRDADYISSLDEEEQKIAFLAISRGQVKENGGRFSETINLRYGAGLVKGASTATIMREIFLGYNWLYVFCATLMASSFIMCFLLIWLMPITWLVTIPSGIKKCAK